MLSVGNTYGGSGSSLALDARVAVGAGVFAVGQADSTAATAEAVESAGQKLPNYNAFEFSYRSDFGRIILLEQNVETGQEVTQIPTEYHLQQYAANQRQQRVQQLQTLIRGSSSGGQSGGGSTTTTRTAVATASTGAKTATTSSAPSAPAASAPAAPVVAASTGAGAGTTAAHVDIKV